MASIKVKFRPSSIKGHPGCIYYQIIHNRTVRQMATTHRVYKEEWNVRNGTIKFSQSSNRESMVRQIKNAIRVDIERLTRIIRKLEDERVNFDADTIVEEFRVYSYKYTLFNYMDYAIAALKRKNAIRTAETYISARNKFKNFSNGQDISLDCITSEIIQEFEGWMKAQGLSPNTTSFYLRILRAVYNIAVDENIIENRNPFRKVYTGVDKTMKRALPLAAITRIKKLDLSGDPKVDYARDMFLVSFYLRGMSFVDMAYLKKTDLQHGYITYRRRKTDQQLHIEWTSEMQAIIDKYPVNPTEYLLPIITKLNISKRSAYKNGSYNVNRNLKKVAELCGITIPLTMYVARHSWASAAKVKGIPLNIISEGLGHDSEATTQIYLSSLDNTEIDRANSIIISSI